MTNLRADHVCRFRHLSVTSTFQLRKTYPTIEVVCVPAEARDVSCSGVPRLYEILLWSASANRDVFDCVMDGIVDGAKSSCSAPTAARPIVLDFVNNSAKAQRGRHAVRVAGREVKRELIRRLHLLRVLWVPHPSRRDVSGEVILRPDPLASEGPPDSFQASAAQPRGIP